MILERALKIRKFVTEYDKAVLNIIYTSNMLTDDFSQKLKPYGLSDQQFNVLRILRGLKGRPLNLFSIQERMLHKSSNVTRLVEKLRQKGLVERFLCEENRRKVEITITQPGLELLTRTDKGLKGARATFGKKLTVKEAELLSNLLNKMRT